MSHTKQPTPHMVADPALLGIADEMKESGGHWQPCTGCYDTEDGHPTQRYDYSPALQTEIGCGCHECGGLGAVWWHMTDEQLASFENDCKEIDAEDRRDRKLATIVAPDNGTPHEVFSAVLECARAWVPEARIIGNVRAGDIARAIESLPAPETRALGPNTERVER